MAIPTDSREPGLVPPARSVAVHLEGVVKTFGDDEAGRRVAKAVDTAPGDVITAVAGIDLDIYDGEFFSMLGPSGSGKTTTLRMIAGFELPTKGRILLHGEDVSSKPPFERDVNTVFQDYALFPHMTVGDNVGYAIGRYGGRRVVLRLAAGSLPATAFALFVLSRLHMSAGGARLVITAILSVALLLTDLLQKDPERRPATAATVADRPTRRRVGLRVARRASCSINWSPRLLSARAWISSTMTR